MTVSDTPKKLDEVRAPSEPHNARIECLDGLRGIAALWVLVGHATILSGWRSIPILTHAGFGVDLFILLSGFLMAFHYKLREPLEPWGSVATWRNFWLRRYFRIAPLYYVMLFAALVLGSYVFDQRAAIDAFNGVAPQLKERYTDTSATNIVMHTTFLFGFSPEYAFRTALPDWSIGLEMQFYLFFPFLMLTIQRFGWIVGTILLAGISLAIVIGLKVGGIAFPMPSFLPLRLALFLAGMLFAAALGQDRGVAFKYLAIAILLLLTLDDGWLVTAGRICIAIGFFVLLFPQHFGKSLVSRLGDQVARLFGTKPFYWLGELSYGVYLIHLLVLIPVAAQTIRVFGTSISPMERFLIVTAISIPVVFGLAAAARSLVEVPGRNIGRRLLSSIQSMGLSVSRNA